MIFARVTNIYLNLLVLRNFRHMYQVGLDSDHSNSERWLIIKRH